VARPTGVLPELEQVHRYHLTWSRDGTWEEILRPLADIGREMEGHDPEPSASVIDARSVRGAATVTSPSRGYDAGKKISGRKAFGIVDTLGLLVAIVRCRCQRIGQCRWDRHRRKGSDEKWPA